MGLVHDVATWWLGQMRDLLPARMRHAEDHSDAILADYRPGSGALTLSRRRRRRETPLGEVSATAPDRAALGALVGRNRSPPRLLLRLPADAVLERSVVLPLPAEPELNRVLAYELDRYTPFTAEEVFWTYEIERRDPVTGQLHLQLALIPRGTVQAVLDGLRTVGLPPAGIVVPRQKGRRAWRFRPEGPGARVRPGQRRALGLAAAGCAVLALAAVALPFIRQERELSEAEALIAASRPAVTEVEALRRRIGERAGDNEALAAEAARLGRPLEVLARLTTILPDDTHLTRLTLRLGVATLTGQSAAAARLIPALSADPAIRASAFAAPVTRQPGQEAEIFTIRVEFQ